MPERNYESHRSLAFVSDLLPIALPRRQGPGRLFELAQPMAKSKNLLRLSLRSEVESVNHSQKELQNEIKRSQLSTFAERTRNEIERHRPGSDRTLRSLS